MMSSFDDNEVNNIIIVIRDNERIYPENIEFVSEHKHILSFLVYHINIIIFGIIFLITFPIFLCDIYYSITSINCLSNNLYNYFLYSSILYTILLYPILIFKICISNEFKTRNSNFSLFVLFIEFITKISFIIWSLFEIIDYFSTIKNSLCHSNINDYFFISSIFRIIFIFLIIFFTHIEKNIEI